MKARYLRVSDDVELSFHAVRAELSEPLPPIPTDAWMAQRGYLRIYDHKPELLANERYTDYVQEIGPERVNRFWNVGQDLPDAEYQARLAAEAAAEALKASDTAAIETARQFTRLKALRDASPAEVSAYITGRYQLPVANLAEANVLLGRMKDDIETLAIAVSAMARKI